MRASGAFAFLLALGAIWLGLLMGVPALMSREVSRDPAGRIVAARSFAVGRNEVETVVETTRGRFTVWGPFSHLNDAEAWIVTVVDGTRYLAADGTPHMQQLLGY